ncbi:MAG: GNAT family N-acetyltransferase [Candidatus Delongbacteria bacterium]|nr:GNAT family N-acetyltransferase [Candidatus Delongbacteria bacterium]
MIYELKKDEYYKVERFFKQKEISRAHYVIGNNCVGRIFVDDNENPNTVVIRWNAFYYIDGAYEDENFINEWYEKFINEIIPEEYAKGGDVAVFVFADENKSKKMRAKLNSPFIWRRKYFELIKLKFDYRSKIPEGFKIKIIDKNLLLSGNFTNLEEIENTIKNEYSDSIDEFMSKSGGFCLIKGNEVVSSATLFYNQNNNTYGMGIYTQENYRQKGYGAIIAAATSEYCINNGSSMNWDCFSGNVASCKLAEKIGHELYIEIKTYPIHYDKYINS